jgi:hypothetical protein
VSGFDVGANRHLWQTRYAELEDELATSPVESLADFTSLVEEMLRASGHQAVAVGGVDPDLEVSAVVSRARELVELNEAGEDVRHDDAQQAAAGLRELFRGLLEHSEADARADLEDANAQFSLQDPTEA